MDQAREDGATDSLKMAADVTIINVGTSVVMTGGMTGVGIVVGVREVGVGIEMAEQIRVVAGEIMIGMVVVGVVVMVVVFDGGVIMGVFEDDGQVEEKTCGNVYGLSDVVMAGAV